MKLNWHTSDLEVAYTQSRAMPSLLNPVNNQMFYVVSKPKEERTSIPFFWKLYSMSLFNYLPIWPQSPSKFAQ